MEFVEKPMKYCFIDLKDLNYNNYFKNQGVELIKRNLRMSCDDPIFDELFEEKSKEIMTPLEEWNIRGFKNNNINDN